MSATKRWEAAQRAKRRGREAYLQGQPREANPYKRGGEWSLWGWWDLGWAEERDRAERGTKA